MAAEQLPEKFYGTFDLDHSENFDEYLTAKGYGWFTRKLVTFATFKKVFAKNANKNLFDYSNLTSKKDVFYKNVQIGSKFEGEGLDNTKHEVSSMPCTFYFIFISIIIFRLPSLSRTDTCSNITSHLKRENPRKKPMSITLMEIFLFR